MAPVEHRLRGADLPALALPLPPSPSPAVSGVGSSPTPPGTGGADGGNPRGHRLCWGGRPASGDSCSQLRY